MSGNTSNCSTARSVTLSHLVTPSPPLAPPSRAARFPQNQRGDHIDEDPLVRLLARVCFKGKVE